jgi:hypothetical protein
VIEVKADQQSTWNVFQNPARMKQWIEGFKRIEMLEGSIGQVGSTYRLLFVQNGEENELFQEITEIEAPVVFSYNMHNDFLVGSSTTTMTEENGITTITSVT